MAGGWRGKGRSLSEETRLPGLVGWFAGAKEMDLAVPSAQMDSFLVIGAEKSGATPLYFNRIFLMNRGK